MIKIYFILLILLGGALGKMTRDTHKGDSDKDVVIHKPLHKIIENPACCEERDAPCIDWATKYNSKDYGSVVGIDNFPNIEKFFNAQSVREDGYFELFNMGNPDILPQSFSLWGSLKPLGKIVKAKSALLNIIETKDAKNTVDMLIAVRFIVKTKSSYSSYLGFIHVRFHGHKCKVTYIRVNSFLTAGYLNHSGEEVLDIAVNTRIGRLYYSVLDQKNMYPSSRFSSIHWIQSVDLTEESLQILFESPHINTIEELEEAFGQYHHSMFAPISSFSLCDCKVAVGLKNGQVHIICCNSLTRCEMIPAPCHHKNSKKHDECAPCKRFIIPIQIEWCCRCGTEKRLFVLYRIITKCVVNGKDWDKTRIKSKTFIRAYSVPNDVEICKDSAIPEKLDSPCKKCDCPCYKKEYDHDSRDEHHECGHERSIIRHLYSIQGCPIVNFRVCCWKKCPLVYVLLLLRGKYYVRVFGENGKYLATAQMEGAVDNHLMTLASYCRHGSRCTHEGSSTCSCSRSTSFTDEVPCHHKSGFCGRCCRCGILLPVSIPKCIFQKSESSKDKKQAIDRIIVKVCAKV